MAMAPLGNVKPACLPDRTPGRRIGRFPPSAARSLRFSPHGWRVMYDVEVCLERLNRPCEVTRLWACAAAKTHAKSPNRGVNRKKVRSFVPVALGGLPAIALVFRWLRAYALPPQDARRGWFQFAPHRQRSPSQCPDGQLRRLPRLAIASRCLTNFGKLANPWQRAARS
jgi:hypothetical protein